jgi:hypothetical protein
MNPNDIHDPGWLFSFLIEAMKWLTPIVLTVGMGVAVLAFSRCRKPGYLVIAVYFAFCIFSLLAMPSIDRAIQAHRNPDVSEQAQRQIDEAVNQDTGRIPAQQGHPVIVAKHTVKIPFGPVILVVGLWLLARREPNSGNIPHSKQTTTFSPRNPPLS